MSERDKKAMTDYSVTYEDRFLFKEIGTIATKPDVAITEIVANSHDAGATLVKITITESQPQVLTIEDNGVGLTQHEFENRWLKLRYDRHKHQGIYVEFPPDCHIKTKRLAFGCNGVGRHAGLCFDDSYKVETWKDSVVNSFDLAVSSGNSPIKVINHESSSRSGHGTKITVNVNRNFINPDDIRDVLSARFLFNPEFHVYINGKEISLLEHPGIVKVKEINPVGNINLKLTLVDSSSAARTSNQHGIAFWLGGRLLGKPSWAVAKNQMIDGRKAFAKRYTLVVESNDLFSYVEPDWSGFKSDFAALDVISDGIGKILLSWYAELSKKDVEQTKNQVMNNHVEDIKSLNILARKELNDFLDQILNENPDVKLDFLELAFKAALNLEKSRSGHSLLEKLAQISPSDAESLDSFLNEWNIVDAMTILAEIDSRIKVIEMISNLSGDHSVDELHALHPLIEKARWAFGPEFDTHEYSSNKGLIKTMETIFNRNYKKENFLKSSRRPDIVVGENSSLSLMGLEEFENDIKRTKTVLLIELKKGGFKIGRDEMNQARSYVEDIWHAGVGSSRPFIRAFVVGDVVDKFASRYQTVGNDEKDKFGEVKAITFDEMVRTAQARLFNLRDKLVMQYEGLDNEKTMGEIMKLPTQCKLM
ncbi:ATP-binding protein [Pantoea agglomerans]|uniref:ATP-binding protein n=1 Tax=Enterobacter agglomerans TaxID=549 RepID=UPI003C7BB920